MRIEQGRRSARRPDPKLKCPSRCRDQIRLTLAVAAESLAIFVFLPNSSLQSHGLSAFISQQDRPRLPRFSSCTGVDPCTSQRAMRPLLLLLLGLAHLLLVARRILLPPLLPWLVSVSSGKR
jgi:hypothetical protein